MWCRGFWGVKEEGKQWEWHVVGVRRGEQITALRILKQRRDDAAGGTTPVEISALVRADKAAMSTYTFDTVDIATQ